MRIKYLRAVMNKENKIVRPGTVAEVDDDQGRSLCKRNLAIEVDDEEFEEAKAAGEPEELKEADEVKTPKKPKKGKK